MWNHPRTPSRRRFAFDLLEGRELLSAAYGAAPQAEFVIISFGPPANEAAMSGREGLPAGREESPSPVGPAWSGPAGWTNDRGGEGFRGVVDNGETATMGPSWGPFDRPQTVPSYPSAMSTDAADAMPAASSSMPNADPQVSGAVSASTTALSAGGGNLAPGGNAGATTSQDPGGGFGMQGAANGAVSNSAVPGGFPVFMRTNMPPPLPFFMMDAADASPDEATGFDRGRSEPFEPLGSLQAPSNPAASSSGPNVQALLPASATVNRRNGRPDSGRSGGIGVVRVTRSARCDRRSGVQSCRSSRGGRGFRTVGERAGGGRDGPPVVLLGTVVPGDGTLAFGPLADGRS